MPRTKRRTVKRPSVDMNMTANVTMANQPKNIKGILEDFDTEKGNIENCLSDSLDAYRNVIESAFLMVKINLSNSLQTNLYDYVNKDLNPVKSNKATTSVKKVPEKSSRVVGKTTTNRITRQESASTSKTRTNSSVAKHKNTNQDVEDRAPLSEKNTEPKFKTPANRPPLSTSATVTPKVNMNEPMSMMRRPNQGEVALSMTGSPLMVSSVSRDDMATVSVPLPNGNILSILPRAGVSMDVSFDEQTKKELLLLKGNIEGLLKLNTGF